MKEGTEFLLNQVKFNNPELKLFLEFCLDKAPEHFWTMPSSSTGKHHPPDENGKGGLVLHTTRVLKVANRLMECWKPPFLVDTVRLASSLHDIARYGLDNTPAAHSLPNHPELGAEFLRKCYLEKQDTHPIVLKSYNPILRHMGKWGKDKPETPEDWIVHTADYIASQYTP